MSINSNNPAPMSVEEAVKRLKLESDESEVVTAYPHASYGTPRQEAILADVRTLLAAYEGSQNPTVESAKARLPRAELFLSTTSVDQQVGEVVSAFARWTDSWQANGKRPSTEISKDMGDYMAIRKLVISALSDSHLLDTGDEEKMDIVDAVRAVRLGESPVPSTGDEEKLTILGIPVRLSEDVPVGKIHVEPVPDTEKEDGFDHAEKVDRDTDARQYCPEHGPFCSGPNCCCKDMHNDEHSRLFCGGPISCTKCAEYVNKKFGPDTEKVKTEPNKELDDLLDAFEKPLMRKGLTANNARQAIHSWTAALVQAEREACAKIADDVHAHQNGNGAISTKCIAILIRVRSRSTGISNE